MEIVATEDDIMLFKLISDMTHDTFHEELDWDTVMITLDIIHSLGADIAIMFGHSIYISIGEQYFNRVAVSDDLIESIFEALHHFSLWYLKTKTNGQNHTP